MRRLTYLSGLLLVLGLFGLGSSSAVAAEQATWNLTGTWTSSTGTTIVVTQPGAATITWVATGAGKAWVNDFSGQISGDSITGTFQDRPGPCCGNHGTANMHIIDQCHMVVTGFTINGGPPTGAGETYTRHPCTPETVPIETVSNGCGGAGWDSLVKVQNWLGNTSTYHNSNDNYNIAVRGFTVDFEDACNLHDAGYAGAVVKDKLRGGIKDFRRWTRLQVDQKFLADMRLLCEQEIPRSKSIALANCRSTGGNFSIGAESRYNFVRCWGDRFFDADLSRPGTQRTGLRANDRIPSTSRECRFVAAHK